MSTHPNQKIPQRDWAAEVQFSSGRTAVVGACPTKANGKLEPSELFVELHANDQTVRLPWWSVVESLIEPTALKSGDLTVYFTAEDRYLFEVAGWDILSAHGVIPRAWKD